jgi:hypothetical protein
MHKQLNNQTFNSYLMQLISSAPLTKRQLSSITTAINFRASHWQLDQLLRAAEGCNCTIDGIKLLKGFETVERLYGPELRPVLVPIEATGASLSLEKPSVA